MMVFIRGSRKRLGENGWLSNLIQMCISGSLVMLSFRTPLARFPTRNLSYSYFQIGSLRHLLALWDLLRENRKAPLQRRAWHYSCFDLY